MQDQRRIAQAQRQRCLDRFDRGHQRRYGFDAVNLVGMVEHADRTQCVGRWRAVDFLDGAAQDHKTREQGEGVAREPYPTPVPCEVDQRRERLDHGGAQLLAVEHGKRGKRTFTRGRKLGLVEPLEHRRGVPRDAEELDECVGDRTRMARVISGADGCSRWVRYTQIALSLRRSEAASAEHDGLERQGFVVVIRLYRHEAMR